MEDINRLIISRIDEAIKSIDMNQSSIAEYIGVAASTISKWRNGKNEISVIAIYKLSKLINKPIGYFFGEETDTKKIIGDGNHVNIGSGNGNNTAYASASQAAEIKALKEKIKDLTTLVQEREARIEELKEMIDLLKGKIG